MKKILIVDDAAFMRLTIRNMLEKNSYEIVGEAINGNYRIVDEIRNDVIFRKFNLMERNYPFSRKFHVIFCRNVMIYFADETKNEVINKFYNMLEPGGYLFIGHTESIPRSVTGFQYVMPSVYRKE